MSNVASQVRLRISSVTQGNKKLKRVESSDFDSDAKREPVTVQGEDKAVGSTFSPGAYTFTFNVYVEKGTPEVDYDALFESGELFTIEREIVGGQTFQYLDVQVASPPAPSGDNAGKHMMKVAFFALDRKRV